MATLEKEVQEGMKLYSAADYVCPVWSAGRVYDEPVGFVKDEKGNIQSGELLFTPTELLAVRSSDLTVTYEEGRDFILSGRRVLPTEGSCICPMEFDEYMPPYADGEKQDWLASADFAGRRVGLTIDILKHQLAVTYIHKPEKAFFTPECALSRLPRTARLLHGGGTADIVFYGDSITAGWEASGISETVIDAGTLEEFELVCNRSPYMCGWTELVRQGLCRKYGADVRKHNRGAGGSASPWGVENAARFVGENKPCLAVIAFGMNQAGCPAENFKADIAEIISRTLKISPETEFLLVSCMVPNTDAAAFRGNQLAAQERALYEIVRESPGLPAAVVPVNGIFREMLSRGKRYFDLSGNNLNHPNDFSVRIYAQAVLAALGY